MEETTRSPTSSVSAVSDSVTAKQPLLRGSDPGAAWATPLANLMLPCGSCGGDQEGRKKNPRLKMRKKSWCEDSVPPGRIFPPTGTSGGASDEELRWADSIANREMMECKSYMVQLCLATDDLAIDQILARLVPVFRHYEEILTGGRRGFAGARTAGAAAGKSLPPEVVDSFLHAARPTDWSFDTMLGGDFTTLLLDLLMYKNERLFGLALGLLFKSGFRVQNVLEHSRDLFLVMSEEEAGRISAIRRDVVTLTNAFHTFESWGVGDSFGAQDANKANATKQICVRLRKLCSLGALDEDTNLPAETVQRNLLDLGLRKRFQCEQCGSKIL